LREKGIKPAGIEGFKNAQWVLMDYGDVVVHVFETGTRNFYGLEKFWLDAPRISFNDENKAGLVRKDKRTVSAGRN
jgi:ribosome-associated protein